MKAHWFKEEENLGDRISPLIIKHVTGLEPKWVPGDHKEGKLLGLGSLLEHVKINDIVWGTGTKFKLKDIETNIPPLAVRGPLTAECFKLKNIDILADPGIILPEILQPIEYSENLIVVIPHYVDYAIVKKAVENSKFYKKEIILVDVVSESFQSVVNKICKAKVVFSSSLHGLIFAEAYKKPAVWLKITDKIIGGNFKFDDYYEGTNRKNTPLAWENDLKFLYKSKPPILPFSNKLKLIEKLKTFYKSKDS